MYIFRYNNAYGCKYERICKSMYKLSVYECMHMYMDVCV